MDVGAESLMKSDDGQKYIACISNKRTGALCENIKGYDGPSINTPYEPGQEIQYRVGACTNAGASECSFAAWKEHTVPGQNFCAFI